jgi:uncharacterized protein YegL
MRRGLWAAFAVLIATWAPVGRAQVNPAGLTVSGPAARGDILKVITHRAAQVRACIAKRQRAVPELAGKLAMRWTIETSGRVGSVEYVASLSTLGDADLVQCLTARIRAWRFPAPEDTVTVTKVFVVAAARAEKERRRKPSKSKGPPAEMLEDALFGTGSGVGAPSGILGDRAGRAGSSTTGHRRPSAVAPKSPAPAKSSSARHAESDGAKHAVAPRAVAAPAMKAGRHDDNKQYNRFLKFLRNNKHLVDYPVNIDERLVIRTLDKNDRSLHNCRIEVQAGGKTLAASVSYADGSTHFFPADRASKGTKTFTVKAACQGRERVLEIQREGVRETPVHFDVGRALPKNIPLDVAIVLDTTGSMQSQIDRLKKTLQAIHLQLTQLKTRPDIRFALVAYRDQGDDYVTRVTHFTGNVERFQRELNKLEADGGGDTPEDLQAALSDALEKLDWRTGAVRLGFVVADAIPHTDYGQKFTYRSAMRESLRRGIKWSTVGAGGLPRKGEVVFRQIAQFTMGEYVFVTQGHRGNSEGGVGEASHHVGTNYRVENLDQAIVRIVRRELSHLTDEPTDFDYTIVASGTTATPRDKVLAPAVREAMRQLTDYCSIRLAPKTPVAILPVETKDPAYGDVSEYLTEQMILTASREPDFNVVERDLRAIAQEMKLQFSDLFNVEQTVKFGKLTGAELLIVARLSVRGEEAELYGKLVRVETGEILSAAKVHFKNGVIKGS